MRLSMKAIADFKSIYKDYFDIELTDDEANIKGLELTDLHTLRSYDPKYRPS